MSARFDISNSEADANIEKQLQKKLKKGIDKSTGCDIIKKYPRYADIAQLVEQLTCKKFIIKRTN